MPAAQDANIPPAPEGRRRLPIGIQTFRTLREGGYYYVDKTGLLGRLVDGGTRYFLSRPRRFGKSLLVDTLKELFEGNRPLFEGLAIHDRWDWTARHPVVRLDFGAGDFGNREHLPQAVLAQLDAAGEDMGVATRYDIPSLRFQNLLKALHVRTGRRVVVLVDEYDKPILDTLERREIARANRDFLRGLYGTIKSSDAHVRFTLLTGVSKFSKISLFSGLNNLQDITLDPRYATTCGYAETDLDAVFAPELPGLDRNEVRDWYDDMAPEALLFQTGYLTIREVESVNGTRYYRLGYPNREVRQSLNQSLLRRLVRGAVRGAEPGPRLLTLLRADDFPGLERLFRAFFAGIPHQWHTHNDMAHYDDPLDRGGIQAGDQGSHRLRRGARLSLNPSPG